MYTTLNKIRKHNPCAEGWKKLLAHLSKSSGDDDKLPLLTILEYNGFDDALWALRAVDGYDHEIRLFAVWCARQVQHLMTDPRSLAALDVAERFANGTATKDELSDAARAARAAYDVAYDAAYAAYDAARAAYDAADAADAAAYAAHDAAYDAAYDVARAAQEAAFRKLIEEPQ